jgi:hypothetical protein
VLSLCLSRACLGKKMRFSIKWHFKVFGAPGGRKKLITIGAWSSSPPSLPRMSTMIESAPFEVSSARAVAISTSISRTSSSPVRKRNRSLAF